MTDMHWLMYANIAAWLGLGLYLVVIAGVQRNLNRRLTQLEARYDD